MKKVFLLLVSIFVLSGLAANAQHFIVKLGYDYANVSVDKNVTVADIKAGRSGWLAGVAYQSEISNGFSIQPELLFRNTGFKITDLTDLRLGYLEIPLNVQWGPDLLIARPYLFGGPFVGVRVRDVFRGPESDVSPDIRAQIVESLKRLEWGVGVGIGVEIFKFQIAGKYNWDFGKLSNLEMSQFDKNNISKTISGAPRTFELTVGLKF